MFASFAPFVDIFFAAFFHHHGEVHYCTLFLVLHIPIWSQIWSQIWLQKGTDCTNTNKTVKIHAKIHAYSHENFFRTSILAPKSFVYTAISESGM